MPFPRQVASALEDTDTTVLPGTLALESRCQGAKFHSPNPLVLHRVTIGSEEVLLCGTCQTNLEVLRHLLVHNEGELDWPVRREFGNQIRALAEREWQQRA